MQNLIIEYVYLILIILVLVTIANKLRIAYPVILVLGGLALSFTTGLSHIRIDPDLVFFIFLPPLLYEAAWQVSWKEFWKWRRVIISFAFPIVIITSTLIAFISVAVIPGFTLALGFLLGGIVSPPDAVSAISVMRQVRAPKSLMTITQGESLLNDATSLIIFRFALAAVLTGQFLLQRALIDFVIVIAAGSIIGILIGLIFYGIHKWLPTTANIDIVLSLVTPYFMYYFADHFNFSGVMAVVSGGLFLSSKRLNMLNYESRIQGVNVWTNITFILNGLIFLLIGLQLPVIVRQLGETSLVRAIWYGLAISFSLVILRLFSTLGASVFTRFVSRFITVADSEPGWRGPLVLGWAGMRGVVSLAAALSIPLLINKGEPFPYRDLILFITFIVILITLVFQGLTLHWLIRKLQPEDKSTSIASGDQEKIIQQKIAESSIKFLEEKYENERVSNGHLNVLYQRLKNDLDFFNQELRRENSGENSPMREYYKIYLDLLEHQREMLGELNKDTEFDEELIRKYFSLIDIEEYNTREKLPD